MLKPANVSGEASGMSLDVMREIPHKRMRKSTFELYYGRKPNTEISNSLNLEELEKLTKRSVSAKSDTLVVYFLNGAAGVSEQLPMKTKKNTKVGSNFHFLFLGKYVNGINLEMHTPIKHK